MIKKKLKGFFDIENQIREKTTIFNVENCKYHETTWGRVYSRKDEEGKVEENKNENRHTPKPYIKQVCVSVKKKKKEEKSYEKLFENRSDIDHRFQSEKKKK